jgi:hypothetical protein
MRADVVRLPANVAAQRLSYSRVVVDGRHDGAERRDDVVK